eukprot:scpid87717/ scgid34670/ 
MQNHLAWPSLSDPFEAPQHSSSRSSTSGNNPADRSRAPTESMMDAGERLPVAWGARPTAAQVIVDWRMFPGIAVNISALECSSMIQDPCSVHAIARKGSNDYVCVRFLTL